jgi:hypothetical protein
MKPLAAILWLLSIVALVAAVPTTDAALITQSGARYYTQAGGGGGGEWADVYTTSSGLGAALATDEQIVGLRGVNTSEYGAFVGPNPNGGSITLIADCSFDGEDCIELVPPDECQSSVDCPNPELDNAGYVTILNGVNITNGGTHAISQINIRFLFNMGSRYVDLASGPKWLCVQAYTAPNNGSPNNRACLFEGYVSAFSGRVIGVTSDETQNYHEPIVPDCWSADCGTANQKILITRATANHGGSPAVTGAGEWICIEMEWDVSTTNGNPDGRNKVYIDTRDGVISRTSSIPLDYEPSWNYAIDSIAVIEGLGWYWNVDGVANADNKILYSHVAVSANREPDERIGCPPGFNTGFLLLLVIQLSWLRGLKSFAVKRLAPLLLLFVGAAAHGQIAYQTSASGVAGGVTSVSTASITFAGSDRYAHIGVYSETQTVTSVTCGAQSATLVESTANNALWIFGLVAPTAGSTTCTANFGATCTRCAIAVVQYTGVHQTTPRGTAVEAAENEAGPGATVDATSASGELVVDVASSVGTVWDSDASQTERIDLDDFDSTFRSFGMSEEAGAATVTMSWTGAAAEFTNIIAVPLKPAGGASSEQEGFRWGVDDGSESAHTFEAAQDTSITIADAQSRLLRALINTTGDLASTAYTLRSQKNGSGGYVAVPIGSTTPGSITNQLIAASSDDAQQSGTTMTLNGTTIGASLDATTEWVGLRFTNITIPSGATITAAAVGVVPSGTGEDEPLVTVFLEAADDCATFTTTASDISNRSRTTGVSWSSTDLGATGSSYHDTPSLVTDFQAVINRAGWASGNDVCVIIQGGSTATRDLTIEAQDLGPNTNPPRLSVSWTVPNEVYINTSSNIAAGGEATTARLTAPSGKTTSDFVTGRRWDDENGSDSIDITTDDYTEVEWLIALSATPANADFFDFRVYAGSSPLDTYTVTPRWTVAGGATSGLLRRRRN